MTLFKIDRDGIYITGILAIPAVLSYIFYLVTYSQIAVWVGLFLLIPPFFSLYFFRDPERKSLSDKNSAISAADGIVVDVSVMDAPGFGDKALRIAVFMNVFNVHVNRSPLPGNVIKTEHRPGKKLNAAIARAEYENECGDTDIETSDGLIRIRQIAGLIARRVVTRVKPGDLLERGSRIGLIRFGSRVDVFLPTTFEPSVKKGEKVKAGITVIAAKS
jgi:phosphatidylserine decarboxylase